MTAVALCAVLAGFAGLTSASLATVLESVRGAGMSPPVPQILYARKYSKAKVHLNPAGSGFPIPEYPKGVNGGEIFYPKFNGPPHHQVPFFVKTSYDNLYGAPTPPGKTVVLFLELTMANASELSSITFTGQNQTGSFVGGQAFNPSQSYLLYEYSQGQEVGSPVPLTYQGFGMWTFTAPLSGQTFLRGVPVVFEFVQD
jgi:hypothetical protein